MNEQLERTLKIQQSLLESREATCGVMTYILRFLITISVLCFLSLATMLITFEINRGQLETVIKQTAKPQLETETLPIGEAEVEKLSFPKSQQVAHLETEISITGVSGVKRFNLGSNDRALFYFPDGSQKEITGPAKLFIYTVLPRR